MIGLQKKLDVSEYYNYNFYAYKKELTHYYIKTRNT